MVSASSNRAALFCISHGIQPVCGVHINPIVLDLACGCSRPEVLLNVGIPAVSVADLRLRGVYDTYARYCESLHITPASFPNWVRYSRLCAVWAIEGERES